MSTAFPLLGAQAAALCLLAAVPVFVHWIRARGEWRLLYVSLGLCLAALAGVFSLFEGMADATALSVTASLLVLQSGMRLQRGRRVYWLPGVVVLVAQAWMLWLSDPGFPPREAFNHLAWAGIAFLMALGYARLDGTGPRYYAAHYFFAVFAVHAAFQLAVSIAYQIRLLDGEVRLGLPFQFMLYSELAVFCCALSCVLLHAELTRRASVLREQLDDTRLKLERLREASESAAALRARLDDPVPLSVVGSAARIRGSIPPFPFNHSALPRT